MTFWTKAATKQKAFLLRRRERTREMERWRRRGEKRGGDTSPCAALHIICMVYTLQAPPPMQMTHKVEIERLWSWCQEWIYTGLPGRACCSKSFSIRWHFQYRAADLQILKLLLPPHPPQSWKQACSSAALLTRLPLSSSPFHPRFTLFFSSSST